MKWNEKEKRSTETEIKNHKSDNWREPKIRRSEKKNPSKQYKMRNYPIELFAIQVESALNVLGICRFQCACVL